jgi:diacylglycerol kinase family enzyme
MKGVTVLRARKVCLSPVADARVYMQIDGEYAGRLPGSVEIVEDALTVLIPPKYKERVGKSVR